jgi:hypothetical protein
MVLYGIGNDLLPPASGALPLSRDLTCHWSFSDTLHHESGGRVTFNLFTVTTLSPLTLRGSRNTCTVQVLSRLPESLSPCVRRKMGSSHPDAELHPVATGTAAEVVAQHQKEEDLKFYSGWFCP